MLHRLSVQALDVLRAAASLQGFNSAGTSVGWPARVTDHVHEHVALWMGR